MTPFEAVGDENTARARHAAETLNEAPTALGRTDETEVAADHEQGVERTERFIDLLCCEHAYVPDPARPCNLGRTQEMSTATTSCPRSWK